MVDLEFTHGTISYLQPGLMTSALVTTEKLTKVFRSWSLRGPNPSLTALAGCTLQVQPGEIFGLLGPNGAGKTTLLRLLLGFLKPTSGRAHIDQQDCYSQSIEVRHRVSYLPGDVRLFRNMNGHQFLEFMSQLRDNTHMDRSHQLADQLNLDLSRRVSNMSTGMKQKVSIARTIVHDPPVIIFDEPTSGLDVLVARNVLEAVEVLRDQGKCIIYSTHIMSEVEKLCERIAIIHRGAILANGHRTEMVAEHQQPNVEELFFNLIRQHDAQHCTGTHSSGASSAV